MTANRSPTAPPQTLDAVLVGGGPCGIAVAAAFKEAGLRYAHLESGSLAQTVRHFAPGMRLYSTRRELQINAVPFRPGEHPSPTREAYLEYLINVVRQRELQVYAHTRVERLTTGSSQHVVRAQTRDGQVLTLATRNVVVASGGYYRPNLLNIPGESLPQVSHYFEGTAEHSGQRVVVVGGRNSAVEAATELATQNARVVLAYRGARLARSRIKPWLLPRFDKLRSDGRLQLFYRTTPTAIEDSRVLLRGPKGDHVASADQVYLLTGYGPDYNLLRQARVPLHKRTGRPLFNVHTLETKVPGVFVAGTVVLRWRGQKASIPNTREHGELLCDSLR